MISFLLLLSLLPAIRTMPPHPTVGDTVVVELPVDTGYQVSVDPSSDFELVAISENRVTLRSFKPGAVTLSTRLSRPGQLPVTQTFSVQIESVLKKNDRLQPAPLKPPRPLVSASAPFRILGAAAGVAALLWAILFFAARRRPSREAEVPAPLLSADAELTRALDRISAAEKSDTRWVELAEALRRYLARTKPELGSELTTSELLMRYSSVAHAAELSLLRSILSEGDWVKFSGKPRRRDDHDVVAMAARALVKPGPVVEEVAA